MKRKLLSKLIFLLLYFAAVNVQAQLPGEDTTERKRTYDVEHIKIEVKLDLQKKTVIGRVTTSIRSLVDRLSTIEIDATGMNIKSVKGWIHNETDNPELAEGFENIKYDYDKKEIKAKPFGSIAKNFPYKYQVEYSTTDPEKGIYFIAPDSIFPRKQYQVWTQGEGEDNRYWFPCYDYPNDKATVETIITVDKKYITLSNGQLTSTKENSDGTKTWHWVLNHPISSYLVMLAAGNFDIIEDKYDNIPVYSYVPVGEKDEAVKSFVQTPDMIKFFSDKISFKYPWGSYSQAVVEDFVYGGMENASATVLAGRAIYDDIAAIDYSATSLVAHELSHQWWGDVVTCRNWNETWLNESFATYFDALYKEYSMGKDEFDYQILSNGDASIAEDSVKSVPIYGEDRPSANVYDKGSVVLNMLRNIMGDEFFWKAMNNYITKNQFSCVTTKDLINALNEVYLNPLLDMKPRDFTWFFNEWIYNAGQPEYKASYTYDDNSKELKFTAYQIQSLDSSSVFHMPVDVGLVTEISSRVMSITPTYEPNTWTFTLDANPLCVIFNKGNKVLCKLYFSKPKEDWLYQLQNSEDAVDRINAARGLKDFLDDEGVINALANTLANDKFWGVRSEAASVLSYSHLKLASETLFSQYEIETNPDIKRSIWAALGDMKKNCPECIDQNKMILYFLDKIPLERSYYLIAEGIKAITQIEDKNRIYDLVLQFAGMDSHNEIIARTLTEALIVSKDKRAKSIFMEYAEYGNHSRLRGLAVTGLGEFLGDKDVIDLLNFLLLYERNLYVKHRILGLLGKAASPSSIPYIKELKQKAYDENLIERINTILNDISSKNSQ
jgi:aminopeptidase N